MSSKPMSVSIHTPMAVTRSVGGGGCLERQVEGKLGAEIMDRQCRAHFRRDRPERRVEQVFAQVSGEGNAYLTLERAGIEHHAIGRQARLRRCPAGLPRATAPPGAASLPSFIAKIAEADAFTGDEGGDRIVVDLSGADLFD